MPWPFPEAKIMSSSSLRPLKSEARSPRLLSFTGFQSPSLEKYYPHKRGFESSGGMGKNTLHRTWVSTILSNDENQKIKCQCQCQCQCPIVLRRDTGAVAMVDFTDTDTVTIPLVEEGDENLHR